MKEEELKKEIFELEQKIKEHDKKMVNSTMNDNHQELLYVHSLLYNNKRVKKAELKGRQEQKKEDIEKEIELLEYLIDDKISTEPLPAWAKYAVEERLEKLKQGLQEKN